LSKAHTFIRCVSDYGISPRWRELLVYLGQQECYGKACEEVGLILGLPVSDSQIHRLTNDYGERVAALLAEEQPCAELADDEVVYAEADGSMIFTRESGWQEVKVGRTFPQTNCLQINKQRSLISQSEYVAHLGTHSAFEAKMSVLVDKYEALGERLVFITDGAPWMANWIKAEYPRATMILDIFHAKEYLSEFLESYFGKENHQPRYRQWSDWLLTEGALSVIHRLEALPPAKRDGEKAREKILNYYQTNAYRMDYPTYHQRGLQLGSGAIEAAHRTVAQSRLKLSGQRWSKQGAQHVLNLRVLNMSGRWNELRDLLRAA